ncbi:MAPEG family protein [Glycocaulis abyssi]|uniref:MAPEG family protein n=1 Tax=Glycocaulis abyssi TaxID=1433403 RepID=A0ABV9N863_9PROT
MEGLLANAEARSILLPAAAHLALVAFLYTWLTAERLLAVRARKRTYADLQFAGADVERGARVAANLRNQFEAPVLFYPLVLVLWATQSVTFAAVCLAWLFVAGRVLHTGVQTLTGNVPLRGAVFTINFLALAGLWLLFLLRQLS